MLILIDESMSGWCPKTNKVGGLPNFTFEPRKPVPLGTMFCNGVECITGLLVIQDVVQNSEQQSRRITVLFDPICLTKAPSWPTQQRYLGWLRVLIFHREDG